MTQPSNIELTEICNRIDFLRKIISLSSSSVIDKTLYLSEEDESWGRQVGVSYTDSQSELPSIAMGRDGNTKLIVEHDWREDTAC
eukprot:jgi/Tetstr1/433568/TSEL_022835.t1